MHVIVCDGEPCVDFQEWPQLEVIRLPAPHRDAGNAARAIGAISALSHGFNGIAFLDSDNWYSPDHIASALDAMNKSGAAVCTTGRILHALDGSELGLCPEVDGERFVDTNCLVLARPAFGVISSWYLMPRKLAAAGDRVIWNEIKRLGLPRVHLKAATVHYRTAYRSHYEHFGRLPPPAAKDVVVHLGDDAHYPLLGGVVDGRPDVSLCMIVRNEEANLERCLTSAQHLVREIIVVDTGSSDQTKEIAGRLGAKVVDFQWVDSFAAARNESIRYATSAWVFWLDADEYLEATDQQRLRGLFAALPTEDVVYFMCQRSRYASERLSRLDVNHPRAFRRDRHTRWDYRVHEQVMPSLARRGARTVWTDIVVSHSGYLSATTCKEKAARNLRLLQLDHFDKGDDPFVLYYLGASHFELGHTSDAITFLRQCVAGAGTSATYWPKAVRLLCQALKLTGADAEAESVVETGIQACPADIELTFEAGLLHLEAKRFPLARAAFERVLSARTAASVVGIDADLQGYRARFFLGLAQQGDRHLIEAEQSLRKVVQERHEFCPAWLAIAEVFLATNRLADVNALILEARARDVPSAVAIVQARFLMHLGDLEQATTVLENANQQSPNVAWLVLFLSELLVRQNNAHGAVALLSQLLEVEPTHRKAARLLARLQRTIQTS